MAAWSQVGRNSSCLDSLARQNDKGPAECEVATHSAEAPKILRSAVERFAQEDAIVSKPVISEPAISEPEGSSDLTAP
jgi:hypothetical protein